MRWAVMCVALCACSRIFGLDNIGNDDRDSDGVPDGIDNCPDAYNPDQSDFDGNGIGDRCDFCGAAAGGSDDDDDDDGIPNECDACDNRLPDDNMDGVPDACEHLDDGGMQVINPVGCPDCQPCTLGPAHDEDGDTLADACDPCAIDPGISTDVDLDGVGDACDASIGLASHQIFDPFSSPNQDWYQIGTMSWNVMNDYVHISPGAATQARVLGTGSGHFVIRTRVSGMAGTNNDTTISNVAASPTFTIPNELVRCSIILAMDGSAPQLQIEHDETSYPAYIATMSFGTPGSAKYELVLEDNNGTLTCSVDREVGAIHATLMAPPNHPPLSTLFSTGISARGGSTTFYYYQMATDN